MVGEPARGLQLGGEVGDAVAERLARGERLAERGALLEIGDGVLEGLPGALERQRRGFQQLAAGTGQSSKASSAVSEARIPILSSLRLTVKPGSPFSTRNIERPSWRRAGVPGPVRAATK